MTDFIADGCITITGDEQAIAIRNTKRLHGFATAGFAFGLLLPRTLLPNLRRRLRNLV